MIVHLIDPIKGYLDLALQPDDDLPDDVEVIHWFEETPDQAYCGFDLRRVRDSDEEPVMGEVTCANCYLIWQDLSKPERQTEEENLRGILRTTERRPFESDEEFEHRTARLTP